MRKRLTILGWIALVAAIVLVARYEQNHDSSSHRYDIECHQQSPPTSTTDSLTCKIDSSKEAEQGKSGPQWWHILLAWPEGITAWAIIFTLIAISTQAYLMRVHADHFAILAEATFKQTAILTESVAAAKASAKAASDQIGMMKDKEQALIQVVPLKLEKLAFYGANKIGLEVVNVGATVALEVSIKAGVRISAKGLKPEEGEYLNLEIPILLKPFEPKQYSVECYIPHKRGGELWDTDSQITIDVWGEFQYGDVFNATHTNFFSFRMNADGFDIMPDATMALKVSRPWYSHSDDLSTEF